MAVLVTGANGFIGSQLCRLLLERGHPVVALCHRCRQRLIDLTDYAHFVCEAGDILDPSSLLRILAAHPIDGICHLAVEPPLDRKDGQRRGVNTTGTRILLDCARDAGIGRIAFTSSMSVYDFHNPRYLPVDEEHPLDPQQDYGREKKEAEEICQSLARERGMRAVILRLAGTYGQGKGGGAVFNFIQRSLRGEAIEIAENRSIDLLYVRDAAAATAAALSRIDDLIPEPGGAVILNIGSGEPTALDQLARHACEATGKEVPIHCHASGSAFYMAISAARRCLDFQPTPLRKGVAEVARWVSERERS